VKWGNFKMVLALQKALKAAAVPHCWGIALALAVVALGGCSSKPLTPEQQAQADLKEYEVQVRKVIADPARADQLVALANEFQRQVRQSADILGDYPAKVAALDANYDAVRKDYEALLGEQDARREVLLKKFGALREQMVALTTDAEWEELKKARLRTLEAYLQDFVS
jgi:hypothetical protein